MSTLAPHGMTVVRGVEAFLVILVAGILSQVTIGGQPVELGTPAGRAAFASALAAALVLALRRAIAANGSSAVGE